MLDEGFRQPVLKLEYTGVSITRDNNYLTPDGSYSMPYRSCSRTQSMQDTSSEESYQESMSKDIAGSISGNYAGFSASASASRATREQKASAFSERQASFQAKSYCTKYKVGWLQEITRPEDVTPQFARVLTQVQTTYKVMQACLPDSALRQRLWDLARSQWMNVFRIFGTHLIDEITLGGKVVFTKKVTERATEEAKQDGVDLSVQVRPPSAAAHLHPSPVSNRSSHLPPLTPCVLPARAGVHGLLRYGRWRVCGVLVRLEQGCGGELPQRLLQLGAEARDHGWHPVGLQPSTDRRGVCRVGRACRRVPHAGQIQACAYLRHP